LELKSHWDAVFVEAVREHTAGSPQHDVVWTNLKPREIAQAMSQRVHEPVSIRIVKQLLKQHGYARRQSQKKKSLKTHPQRDAQFQRITQLKEQYLERGQPVVSIDTKKKELLGNFYRRGKLYTRQTLEVLDHDFPSYSDGKVIPHGLYDIGLNKAHVNLGTSSDTTEFACDSVAHWWHHYGRHDHPGATQLLLLCDGGGSNPSNSSLFKQDLQGLANRIGLQIRVAHFPPYCSKHNPIEHRVFSHVTRACEGVVFTSVSLVKQLVERTSTSSGLSVTADILDRIYETGRKAASHFKSSLQFAADSVLPKWNYVLSPQHQP
jgi:hypothetical protein